jgi:hypothetical protein
MGCHFFEGKFDISEGQVKPAPTFIPHFLGWVRPFSDNISPYEMLKFELRDPNLVLVLELEIYHGLKQATYPVSGPPFTPYPLFQWYPQSKDILLNLSMKGSNSV